MQWYFDEVFRGTGTVDWSVEVAGRGAASRMGFFQSEGGEFQEGCAPEVAELFTHGDGEAAEEGEDEPKPPFLYDVLAAPRRAR